MRDSIAIVGGGITGLTLAYKLSKNKTNKITIFEKEKNIGGLANSFKVNNIFLEKYYHHFFSSDTDLIKLSKELGIYNKIKSYPSSVGFYINNRLLPFTSPFDLLKFTPIPLYQRIIMGLLTLYLSNTKNWIELEKLSCNQFFKKIHCQELYNTIWKPLLVSKFGKYEKNIPMSFLWGRINPRAKSRTGAKEKLLYFNGGFKILTKNLLKKTNKKTKFVYDRVIKVTQNNNETNLETKSNTYSFDKIIFTINNKNLLKIYKQLNNKTYKQLKNIEYQAINCLVLETDKKVSPYYWLNIVDNNISFSGIIEHTNLITDNRYKSHIIYLFNYLQPDHKLYTEKPENVYKRYSNDLRKVFPKSEFKILKWHLFRDKYATPIYKGNYSKTIPPFKLSHNIYLFNTSQIYPEDRNVNNSIAIATKLAKQLKKSF